MISIINNTFKLRFLFLIKLTLFCILVHPQTGAINTCLSSYNATLYLPSLKQNEEMIIKSLVDRLLIAARKKNIDVLEMIEQNSFLVALQKESAGIPKFMKKIKIALEKHRMDEESAEKKAKAEEQRLKEEKLEAQRLNKEETRKRQNQGDTSSLNKNDLNVVSFSNESQNFASEILVEKISRTYNLSDGTIVLTIPDSFEDIVAKQDPTTGNLVIQSKIFKGFHKPQFEGYVSLPNGKIAMYELGQARLTKDYVEGEGGPDFLWIAKPETRKKPLRIPILEPAA